MVAFSMTMYIVPVINKGEAMKINYRLRQLSQCEQEYFTMVLHEEIEMQRWFGIAHCPLMCEEVLLTLQ